MSGSQKRTETKSLQKRMEIAIMVIEIVSFRVHLDRWIERRLLCTARATFNLKGNIQKHQ